MATMINTKRVRDRRTLRFDDLQAAVDDAQRLVETEQRGALRGAGNWSLGQTLGHLAFWADAPFDGFPEMSSPPWIVKALVRLMRRRLLYSKLDPGVFIRGVPGGTFGTEPLAAAEGLAKMKRAFERMASQCPTVPNPIFGEMTHDEWKNLHQRHAELHLSFFHVQ